MKIISKRGSKSKKQDNANKSLLHDDEQFDDVLSDVQSIMQTGELADDEESRIISQIGELTADKQKAALPGEAPGGKAQEPAQPVQSVESTETETPENALPEDIEEKHLYPEAALSEKQLTALQMVIGKPTGKGGKQPSDGLGDLKDFLSDSKEPKGESEPIEIKMDDKSVVKTVFLVIFLVLAVLAAGFAGWYYWWTTYATFEYTLQPVVILEGQTAAPEDFLAPEENRSEMTADFLNPGAEPFVGLQYVPLILTLGWRTVDTAAALYVLAPVEYVEHEFTEEGLTLRPVDFLQNPEVAANISFDIRFTESPMPLEDYPVGEFPIHLALNGAPFDAVLKVSDTTPPTATTQDITIQVGDEIRPEDFLLEYFDPSPPVTLSFAEEPNVFMRGDEQTVKIVLEDAFGNSTVYTAELSISFNQVPPVIEGVEDGDIIESGVGSIIDYFSFFPDLTAHDDFGRELEIQIDSDDVDIDTEGTYTAVISAEDLSGLRTDVEVAVHILGIDPEDIYQQVDSVLDRITNDGMSQVEIAGAIHNYISRNLRTGTDGIDSDSLLAGAHIAIEDGRGDSSVFSSYAAFLIDRAGIPNMLIVRKTDDEDAQHRWNLINPDEKGWHHFDSYPTGLSLGSLASMFTDKEAEDIAKRIKDRNGTENYYTYDSALYPEIVKGE